MTSNGDFLSIDEFAALLKIHPNTVRNGIKYGRINAFRVGKGKRSMFRIPKSEIHRMAVFDLKDYNDLNGTICTKTT